VSRNIRYRWASFLIAVCLYGDAGSLFAQTPNDYGAGGMPSSANPTMQRYGDNYGVVPETPYNPETTSRPANWVGAPASNENAPPIVQGDRNPQRQPEYPTTGASGGWIPNNGSQGIPNQILNQTEAPQLTPGTTILARVGSEAIYASEVTPLVDRWLNEIKSKMKPEEVEMARSEFEMRREMSIKQVLKMSIESRLYYQDVKRDLPPEAMGGVEKQLTVEFERSEIPKLMKQEKVATYKDLESKLNAISSSIALEKKKFIRNQLVGEWIRRQIKPDEMPTVTEMVQYYEKHKPDFTTPAKVRWEEMKVDKSKYATKQEALAAIAQLGNRVLVAREPFSEVAKQSSDGFTSQDGGVRDWATQDSLADKEIEKALFSPSLPVGQLSQIIETSNEYCILRIIERVDAKTEDFLTAQDKIRDLIKKERIERQKREYLERLAKRTPIWTIYDGDGNNRPLSDRLTDEQDRPKGVGTEMLGRSQYGNLR
jgi:parvulin-like peptidyl-prolyl isomerase